MTKTIAIVNQKGGVAKTSTAVNLAYCLAKNDLKVLLIDLDPQGNSTMGLGINKNDLQISMYHVLSGTHGVRQAIRPCFRFSLLPGNGDLTAVEVELAKQENGAFVLKQVLQDSCNDFDFVLIDCPPSLSTLTVSALTAAMGIIIPVQCEYYALEGLTDLLQTVDGIKKTTNPDLDIFGILRTMYDARVGLSHQVSDELVLHFKGRVFNSIIPRNVRIAEAPSHGVPVGVYDARSQGALSYEKLAYEVIKRDRVLYSGKKNLP